MCCVFQNFKNNQEVAELLLFLNELFQEKFLGKDIYFWTTDFSINITFYHWTYWLVNHW
jgi:hypothetical protein